MNKPLLNTLQFRSLLAALCCLVPMAVLAAEYPVPDPYIHAELKEHTRLFDKKIYRVADNVYSAVGWGLANIIMVVGDDGIIIVDTGEDVDSAAAVFAEFRKISTLPVKAVIYTHFHPDHINGVKAFVSEEQVWSGEVQIIAHETLLENVINQGDTVGPILGMRSAYTSGVFLDPAESQDMNFGIGPRPNVGRGSFIAPTVTFADRKRMTIAGVELELRHVPSEAPDEVAVYLVANRVLLSAETLQGPTMPNIHTLRGTKFRDPKVWYQSLDVLRSYEADYMVPAHGQPVSGKDEVERVLRVTRDGIQFVHDQTIRYMNKGYTPDELAGLVVFPDYLANEKPWLREYYGTVKHSVRQIYQGYLGWFTGDPVALDPIPPVESARRHVELMGGRDIVLSKAQEAYAAGDFQWAAELATYLIRINHEDMDARQLKAASFRNQGYAQINANWRNWYLTSARELDGSLDIAAVQRRIAAAMSSPDFFAALPMSKILEGLSVRLRAEQTLDTHIQVAFEITDTGETHAVEIRRGVAQFHENAAPAPDVTLSGKRQTILGLLLGQVDLQQAVASGELRITGNAALLGPFMASFDAPSTINLTVR